MDKKFDRIDELSRGSLGNLEKDPPPMSFDKIRKRVFWYSMWSLSFGSFMRRFWSIPAAAAVVAVVLYQLFSAGTTQQPADNALAESRASETMTYSSTNRPLKSDNSNVLPENTNASSAPGSSLIKNRITPIAGNRPEVRKNSNNATENNNNQVYSETVRNSEAVTDKSMNLSQNHEIINTAANNQNNAVEVFSEDFLNPDKMPVRFDLYSDRWQNTVQPVSDAQTNFGHRLINWSFYVAGGAGYSGAMFTPITENQPEINKDFSLSTQFALDIRADFGKWFIAAGLHHFSSANRFSSDRLLFNARTENMQNLTNQFWLTDSTGYWHYTYVSDISIHVLDSVWAWEIDSVLVQEFDTVSVTKYDTLQNAHWKRNEKYLELPVTAGKTFSVNRFTLGLSGGFGIGIVYLTEGTYYPGSSNSQAYVAITSSESKKISLSFVAAGSISYLLNEQLAIEFSPWYRKMLTPAFSGEWQGAQKPWSAGLSAGLRYYF